MDSNDGCPHGTGPLRSDHAAPEHTTPDPLDARQHRHCHAVAGPVATNTGAFSGPLVALFSDPSPCPGCHDCDRDHMGRDGMCDLWDRRIGPRSGDRHQHIGGTRGIGVHAGAQYRQRERELRTDRFWRSRILGAFGGTAASRIPPSQSSFPFLILTGLTVSKPACFSQAVVSATE